MLRTRKNRHANNVAFGGVTKEPILAAGSTMEDLATAADSKMGIFIYNNANRRWESTITALVPNQKFFFAQKMQDVTGGDSIVRKSTDLVFTDLSVRKRPYVAPVKQLSILHNLPTAANIQAGTEFQIALIDTTNLTLPYDRYGYGYKAKTGDTAFEILTAIAAEINDDANLLYQNAYGRIFEATVAGAGDTASLAITTTNFGESFQIAKVSDSLDAATVSRSTLALGDVTVNGQTTSFYNLGSGTDEEIKQFEKDMKSQDGYGFGYEHKVFPDEKWPAPALFAEQGCFYTQYFIDGFKEAGSKAAPITRTWDKLYMSFAAKQADAGTPSTIFDTVLGI